MLNKSSWSKQALFILTILVSAYFLFTPGSHASDRSLWKKRQASIKDKTETQKPVKKTYQRVIDPLKIKVPEEFGTVIESHRGSNGKLIVHIQDAHANYEGQMNLAHILESLIKDYDLNLILVEGGSTNSDFTYLRNRASLKERKEKAEKLLKDGIITGEEYLNIAFDYPMSFQGIEDRTVYDANVAALWEIDKFKGVAAEYVNKMTATSEALKPKIYNKQLLELDKTKKDCENKKIDIIAYYRYLYNAAQTSSISVSEYPNLRGLIRLDELENKIDLDKIKQGKASEKELSLYKEHIELSEDININKAFKEEPLLESALRNTLATNRDQETLIRISKALTIMKDLLSIKVVPGEYDYFLKNKKDFDPKFWADFLKAKSRPYDLSLKIPKNYYIIKDNLQKIEHFYNIAEERNNVFLRKTEARINKDNAKIAALIAGGFHTPMLIRLLAENGYSYTVISPKISKKTDESFYRSTLRRQWLPEIEEGGYSEEDWE